MNKFASLLFLGVALGLSQDAASQFVGRKVDPGTKIRIAGEVEKDWLSSMEVEVKRIELIDTKVKDQSGSTPSQ